MFSVMNLLPLETSIDSETLKFCRLQIKVENGTLLRQSVADTVTVRSVLSED